MCAGDQDPLVKPNPQATFIFEACSQGLHKISIDVRVTQENVVFQMFIIRHRLKNRVQSDFNAFPSGD